MSVIEIASRPKQAIRLDADNYEEVILFIVRNKGIANSISFTWASTEEKGNFLFVELKMNNNQMLARGPIYIGDYVIAEDKLPKVCNEEVFNRDYQRTGE